MNKIYKAEVIFSGFNGWDITHKCSFKFRNVRKCIAFAGWYSLKHDVLVRIYSVDVWIASYVNGKEVWNIY